MISDRIVVDSVGLSGGVASVRKDGFALIVDCDEITTRLVGWSADEMVGKRSVEFIYPSDRQRAVESWVQVLEAPERAHRARWRHLRKDGSYVWVEVTNHNLLRTDGYVLTEMVEAVGEQPGGGEEHAGAADTIAACFRALRLTVALGIEPPFNITLDRLV